MTKQGTESSVLVSLNELLQLEVDRVKQEEAERQQREQELERAKLLAVDAERRRVAQAELLQAQAILRAEERAREEQARLEAIKSAELERARLTAEAMLRAEETKRREAHELAMAAVVRDRKASRLRLAALGSVAALLVGAITVGIVLERSRASQEHLAEQHSREVAAQQAEVLRLQRELAAQDEAIRQAESAIAAARDESARADAQRRLDSLRAERTRLGTPLGSRGSASPATRNTPAGGSAPCQCPKGDPLCSCL